MKAKEKYAEIFFLGCATVSILALLLIFLFLFANGLPAIGEIGLWNFLTGTSWRTADTPPSFGILPMIVGSLYMTAGAVLIGVPVGIFTAIFLAFMCPRWMYAFLKPAVNLLAGIPSVVYGFFGMVVIVPFVRTISLHLTGGGSGASILSAMILLGIMILPVVINISESALRAVPESYYQGALALGASHTRSVFFVVLPAAKSGVFASVILGLGRAVGETMAVVMVAGNQPRMPEGILRGARTLTANIVIEMGYATDLHRHALIATGIVLLIFILLINIIFTFITRRSRENA
ncbi:MAG: phosphate ABC transporter permease subunit PstC [Defluviitaleaceae bacterium]|nr:phosphate ABC transporter permease subunit PstC [Defluviitaleaceae bacterium]